MATEEGAALELDAALRALCMDSAQAPFQSLLRHPERLAMRFGQAVLKALEESDVDLQPALIKSLNELAALLNSMSARTGELWTSEAVLNNPSWHQVQELARKALADLGARPEPHALH